MQQARVEPRGLAVAEGVIKIEAHFYALEQCEAFDVADRDRVLENEPRMVGAQGQPVLRRNTRDEYFDATTQAGVNHVFWIAVGKSVQLAVAHRGCVASEIEHSPALSAAQFLDDNRRRFELGGERDFA